MLKKRTRLLGVLLCAVAGSRLHCARVRPDTWVPARWDGGPLEVAHRAKDKALADPAVREAISRWYEPATLDLLEGTPINCLLVTLSAGADPEIEKQQQQLVKEYARWLASAAWRFWAWCIRAPIRAAVASAADDAQLDGLVLEGEFPGGPAFAEQLEKTLRSANSSAVVIPVASSRRFSAKRRGPCWLSRGYPQVSAKVAEDAPRHRFRRAVDRFQHVAGAVVPPGPDRRPVWISQRPRAGIAGQLI